jgi:inner membrane protein
MEQQVQLPQEQSSPNAKNETSNKAVWKALIVTLLTIVLLLPISLIQSLVNERSERQNQVIDTLNKKWASPQTLSGPMLMVPFYETTATNKNPIKRWAYFLPDELNVNGTLVPEVRKKSLYEVDLMRAKLSITGKFAPLSLKNLNMDTDKLIWSQAKLVMGLTDSRGMSQEPQWKWSGKLIDAVAALPSSTMFSEGLSSAVVLDPAIVNTFQLELDIKSSKHLYLQAWGNHTQVSLLSHWHAPNFEGMPDTVVKLKEDYKATWRLNDISRPYPQQWKGVNNQIKEAKIGVAFANTNENYIMTERIVKYAVLFIALTFSVFFLIEIWQKVQIHPLQYGFVGIALCVFYILVLSISEFIGFSWAYLISSTATILLLALYLASIFKRRKTTIGFTIGLSILYAYIYFLIQLEEMSLIFGSVAFFIVLATIMMATRKVNWYKLSSE